MSVVNNKRQPKRVKPLIESVSTQAQNEAEYECRPFFIDLATMPPNQVDHLRETGLLHSRDTASLDICLLAEKHVKYLQQTWDVETPLRTSFVSLDASRPWMLYWTLQACDLMGHSPDETSQIRIVQTLESCWTPAPDITFSDEEIAQDPILQKCQSGASSENQSDKASTTTTGSSQSSFSKGGGFGGGPGQLAHAATTYGAVLALCIIAQGDHNAARQAALQLLTAKRLPLYLWMRSLQQADDGAFVMHHDGERDVRATYCLLAVAKLLGILTPQLGSPSAIRFVASCQTWEGGFGGEPAAEAHGGYAFCATAALQLLRAFDAVDVDALTAWLTRRQMSYEGGFNGRSNKLVDGCYSFWQGGAMAIVSMYHHEKETKQTSEDPWFAGKKPPMVFDEGMLERYVLLCGQDVNGGLRDKPSKRRDFYHSCYCLSGLSVAQSSSDEADSLSFGHDKYARVHATHPVYNIRIERAQAMVDHFKNVPLLP